MKYHSDFEGNEEAAHSGLGGLANQQRREAIKLVGKLALSTVPVTQSLLFSEQVSAASPPSSQSALAKTQGAWQTYHRELNDFREWMLAQPYAKHPMVRAQAEYLAQQMPGAAFMYYGASHTGYPLIRSDSFLVPLMYNRGFPNPDFVYRYVFLDGARRYRMWGKLGSARTFNNIQLFPTFWGDKEPSSAMKHFSILDYVRSDGTFEIFLGPDVSTGKGTGIRLNSECHRVFLAFREAIIEWGKETRMDISIELLGDVRDPIVFDEAEMAERTLSSARYINFQRKFLEFTWKIALGDGVWNQFKKVPQVAASSDEVGANPVAQYFYLPYDIAEDEALVIEMMPPKCSYWGTQMMDMWLQTNDYSFHQSSLNNAQSVVDSDGLLRLVIAHRDPGVPNWIDTVAPAPGILVYRVYEAQHAVAAPMVKRVPLADVRKEVPAATKEVTAEQRKVQLKARAHASLGRYGYF